MLYVINASIDHISLLMAISRFLSTNVFKSYSVPPSPVPTSNPAYLVYYYSSHATLHVSSSR